jgi:hypothetical protein
MISIRVVTQVGSIIFPLLEPSQENGQFKEYVNLDARILEYCQVSERAGITEITVIPILDETGA